MVFTKEEIEDIKSECFAMDVQYNYDVLNDWDEDKIRDYFENGGGGELHERQQVNGGAAAVSGRSPGKSGTPPTQQQQQQQSQSDSPSRFAR